MKFISKSSNLLIVLRAGLQAQPITGTPAKATVSVRFKDGVAEVPEGELLDMMLKHPGFNYDFICAEDVKFDPYAASRQPAEPTHVMTELKFGNAVGRKVSETPKALPPEFQAMINDAARKMASEMLPGMVEQTLQTLLKTPRQSADSDTVLPKKGGKKGGRPGKKGHKYAKAYVAPAPIEEAAPEQQAEEVAVGEERIVPDIS